MSAQSKYSILTRRAFVGLAGTGAVVVGLGGLIRFFDREDRIIRPPGALPEPEFLSICIKCDKCRRACPYGYISPVPITESLISFDTPKLQAQTSGNCPRCWRCIYACPTGALTIGR